MLAFITANAGWIAFAASELIGMIPGFKSSSVVQAVVALVKQIVDKLAAPAV